MLRRTHIHPLFCRGTSSETHISTGLTLDEASSAALVRMIVGCPQLTELELTGTFEFLRSFSFDALKPLLYFCLFCVFSVGMILFLDFGFFTSAKRSLLA
jgi:hypothetical protein